MVLQCQTATAFPTFSGSIAHGQRRCFACQAPCTGRCASAVRCIRTKSVRSSWPRICVWLCGCVAACCGCVCVCACVYVCVGELRVTPRRNFVCSYPPKARVAALANTLGITEKRVCVTLPHCSSMVWRVPMADTSHHRCASGSRTSGRSRFRRGHNHLAHRQQPGHNHLAHRQQRWQAQHRMRLQHLRRSSGGANATTLRLPRKQCSFEPSSRHRARRVTNTPTSPAKPGCPWLVYVARSLCCVAPAAPCARRQPFVRRPRFANGSDAGGTERRRNLRPLQAAEGLLPSRPTTHTIPHAAASPRTPPRLPRWLRRARVKPSRSQ